MNQNALTQLALESSQGVNELSHPAAALVGKKCEEREFFQLQSQEAATYAAYGKAQSWQESRMQMRKRSCRMGKDHSRQDWEVCS